MENKELICRYLLWTLQKTRHLWSLQDLIYDVRRETVITVFQTEAGVSSTREINVEADSGIAMIRDVIRALE